METDMLYSFAYANSRVTYVLPPTYYKCNTTGRQTFTITSHQTWSSRSANEKLDQAEVQMRFECYCEGKDFSGGGKHYTKQGEWTMTCSPQLVWSEIGWWRLLYAI